MKKIFAIVLAGIMMLSLAACGGTGSSTPAAVSSEPAGASGTPASSAPAASTLSGKVTTGGSTSVEKVVGAFIEAFMAENSGVDVTYDPTGSGAGITGAAEGTLDIGLSSRALKDDEAAGGLTATTFALDGIAIIVNSENTVEDLTLEQIKGLATGEISEKLGRGRHTTRHVELFPVAGGLIADTPGFSAFDNEKGGEPLDKDTLDRSFREFRPYLGQCRFIGCAHIKEKGCAVLAAVKAGDIPKSRHRSYVRLYELAKENKPWEK